MTKNLTSYYRKDRVDGSGTIYKVVNDTVYYYNEIEKKWKESDKCSVEFCWNGIEYEDLTEEEAMELIK